jgi:hypothetical protein
MARTTKAKLDKEQQIAAWQAELDKYSKLAKNAEERLAAHEDAIKRAEAELLALTTPVEPEANGSVVRFTTTFSRLYMRGTASNSSHYIADNVYTYAAIKRGVYWYLTQDGSRSDSRKSRMIWPTLLDFCGKRNWDTIEVIG